MPKYYVMSLNTETMESWPRLLAAGGLAEVTAPSPSVAAELHAEFDRLEDGLTDDIFVVEKTAPLGTIGRRYTVRQRVRVDVDADDPKEVDLPTAEDEP